jgi:tRNA G18 (ribose-2'-O)-methylase SpoU
MKYRKLKLDELGRKSVSEFQEADKFPLIFVLDNIRSALNVGSIFRTADALGLDQLLLYGITAQPPHKEINKTAIGATASVSWNYFSNATALLKYLKAEGYLLVGVEQTEGSTSLQNWKPDFKNKYALFFGNEVDGVSEEFLSHLDIAIEIPQFGTKHSFNVAVSAGILGWHALYTGHFRS